MRVALVGADFEENLGIGAIAACAQAAGHSVRVVPFNQPEDAPVVARSIAASAPDVVGLSMQFQHRAAEFLGLARQLRAEGFSGHLTCGGRFPSAAWRELLERDDGIDSVVLYDGEESFVELLAALSAGRPLSGVRGLALRGEGGAPIRTPGRPLPDLDALPLAHRYRAPARHFGVPFLPIMGARGCWGDCTFCSVTSHYRDARRYGGGRALRLRAPERIAEEMALLWHRVGPSIFCFHDDTLLLPRPEDSLARLREIRGHLDALGVGKVALVGKARPDCLTEPLAKELAALGVIRLYVGVENASARGAAHLRRSAQTARVQQALAACRSAGIFVCYNLLVFEPETRLEDVRENVAFMRQHASLPVNFCRAEPYHATPLHRSLEARQALGGSFLGWNYRIEDDRAELLFRICSAAFRERNFDPEGVANRTMGLGYAVRILETFYREIGGERAAIGRRAAALTESISRETAALLEEALSLAERLDPTDHDRVARETALLGLAISALDRERHAELDELKADMTAFAERARAPAPPARPPTPGYRRLLKRAAIGASVAVGVAQLNACVNVVDPAPPDLGDAMVVDPPPPDAGADGSTVVDPLPPDAAADAATVLDPLPPDAGADASTVVDPPPPDAGRDASVVVDPLPPDAGHWHPRPGDAGVVDPVPRDGGIAQRERTIDQWRDSGSNAVRSADLPLYAPPRIALRASREGSALRVSVAAPPGPLSLRWEGDGAIEGEGREVLWRPSSGNDQIRVGARTRGGVAVATLRARDVG